MARMNSEIEVLRALLRLARRRSNVTLAAIVDRVDVEPRAAQRALASLSRSGLVFRGPDGLRLTLAGFAIAVATTAAVPAKRSARRPPPVRTQRPGNVLVFARRAPHRAA